MLTINVETEPVGTKTTKFYVLNSIVWYLYIALKLEAKFLPLVLLVGVGLQEFLYFEHLFLHRISDLFIN